MFDKIEVFRMAGGLASYAADRQSQIARNLANADTPDFRARDLAPFSETYRADDQAGLRRTRAGHLLPGEGAPQTAPARIVSRPGAASPNGNNVSLEGEMVAAADVQREHELALSIYQTSLNILRTSIGRGR